MATILDVSKAAGGVGGDGLPGAQPKGPGGQETARRVNAAVEALSYTPNVSARNLRRKREPHHPDTSRPTQPTLLHAHSLGHRQGRAPLGYSAFLCDTGGERTRPEGCWICCSPPADGAILLATESESGWLSLRRKVRAGGVQRVRPAAEPAQGVHRQLRGGAGGNGAPDLAGPRKDRPGFEREPSTSPRRCAFRAIGRASKGEPAAPGGLCLRRGAERLQLQKRFDSAGAFWSCPIGPRRFCAFPTFWRWAPSPARRKWGFACRRT